MNAFRQGISGVELRVRQRAGLGEYEQCRVLVADESGKRAWLGATTDNKTRDLGSSSNRIMESKRTVSQHLGGICASVFSSFKRAI